jgi:hypothetical protein
MPRQLPTRAAAEGDQFFDALTDAVVTAQVWRTWADFVTPQLLPSATLGAAIAYMRANGTLVDDGAFADLITAASVAWLTANVGSCDYGAALDDALDRAQCCWRRAFRSRRPEGPRRWRSPRVRADFVYRADALTDFAQNAKVC